MDASTSPLQDEPTPYADPEAVWQGIRAEMKARAGQSSFDTSTPEGKLELVHYIKTAMAAAGGLPASEPEAGQ